MPQPTATEAFEEDFPVFCWVLDEYYPKRELEFFADYTRKGGEESLEFQGLGDELRQLARKPKTAAALINATFKLDTAIEPAEARHTVTDLYDRLNGRGEFDPERIEKAEVQAKVEVAKDPSALFSGYASRYIRLPAGIPGRLPKKMPRWLGGESTSGLPLGGARVPLWFVFLFGVFLLSCAGIIYATMTVIPIWLIWLPTFLVIIGGAIVFLSALSMMAWRRDYKKPEKAAKRRERVADFSEKKSTEKPKSWRRWMRL